MIHSSINTTISVVLLMLLSVGHTANRNHIGRLVNFSEQALITINDLQTQVFALKKEIKSTNQKTKELEKDILSYTFKEEKIRVAKAIQNTIPLHNPFEGCRDIPTPATINTIANTLVDVCRQYRVSYALVLGIMRQESLFCQEAVSPVGAQGIMQIMPQTAIEQAKEIYEETGYSPQIWKLKDNITMGVYYISKRLNDFHGDEELALKAYNGGVHHVYKVLTGEQKDFYQESNKYADAVLKFKKEYQQMKIR